MRPLTQIVLLGVAAVAVGGAWAVDLPAKLGAQIADNTPDRRTGRTARQPVAIVRNVRMASAAAVIEAVGSGKALKAVMLYPEVEGRITEILFKAGDKVKAGQPLLRLDREQEELDVALARVNLANASRTVTRYESVDSGRAVAHNRMDEARKLQSLAKIRLSQAELALRKRTLVAPFSGVMGIAKVQAGDRVAKTTQVASLDDRSALLVDFEVPAALAFGVRKGASFKAITWALRGETFTGTISALGSRINQETRTLHVRARIPNAKDLLRPGMAFSITLPLAGKRYPSVPSVAIRWQRKGAFVWVVREGVARRVRVDVIKRNEGWVLVDAKLAAGDGVVVEGVQQLRPGIKVRTERAEPSRPEAPK